MRDTIDMAREAGIRDCTCSGSMGCLKAFEAFVRADERKQVALDKKAENARGLGLDYEPVQDVSLIDEGKTATPVQEPVALVIDGVLVKSSLPEKYTGHLYTTPPAAQRTWVGLTDEEIEQEFGFIDELLRDCVYRTEAKLKEKNT